MTGRHSYCAIIVSIDCLHALFWTPLLMDSSDVICMYIVFIPVLIVAYRALRIASRQRSTFPESVTSNGD